MGSPCGYKVFTAALALGLLATGCGESKLVQCERLNQVTNRMAGQVQKFTRSTTPSKYSVDLANIAADLETTAGELQALKFGDARLRELQAQFTQMYLATSRASRDLLAASEKRDAAAGAIAIQALKEATNQETRLVSQANQYCCPSVDSSNRCRPQ